MIPIWTLVERTANSGRAGKAQGAVLNLLLLQQPWKWTKAPWRALLGSDLLQRQNKGADFSVKMHLSQDLRSDFRQGIVCCCFQCRAGPRLGGCSDDSSVRNCWRWYPNFSVTHSCITDFFPFAGVFLLLRAKNSIVGKICEALWALLVPSFTLERQGLNSVCSFWGADQFSSSVWWMTPVEYPNNGISVGWAGGQWRCWGDLQCAVGCISALLFIDKPISWPSSLQISWGKSYPECWSLLLLLD